MYEKEISEFKCEARNNGIDSAQTSDAPLARVIGKLVMPFNPNKPQISSFKTASLFLCLFMHVNCSHKSRLLVPVEKLNLTVIPVISDITEDSEVHLLCSALKGTPPITFTWYQDWYPINTTTVLTNYAEYILPSVSGVHSGKYYCQALNEAGDKEDSSHVMVTGQTIKIYLFFFHFFNTKLTLPLTVC